MYPFSQQIKISTTKNYWQCSYDMKTKTKNNNTNKVAITRHRENYSSRDQGVTEKLTYKTSSSFTVLPNYIYSFEKLKTMHLLLVNLKLIRAHDDIKSGDTVRYFTLLQKSMLLLTLSVWGQINIHL